MVFEGFSFKELTIAEKAELVIFLIIIYLYIKLEWLYRQHFRLF
jgi:hypothetical protein